MQLLSDPLSPWRLSGWCGSSSGSCGGGELPGGAERRHGRRDRAEAVARRRSSAFSETPQKSCGGRPTFETSAFAICRFIFWWEIRDPAKPVSYSTRAFRSSCWQKQNRQGAPITSTETLNIWLVNGCIVIEAPSPVWKDQSQATALLLKLRYSPLRMIFGTRRNAPRAVIACIPADQLGSGPGLEASVSPLNDFLLLASQQLGIALPVYAVLTRADAIGGFREIFFNLKPDEATEVLGVSLDSDQLSDRATYAEIAQSTLNDACKRLVTFLQSAAHFTLLVREYDLKRASGPRLRVSSPSR